MDCVVARFTKTKLEKEGLPTECAARKPTWEGLASSRFLAGTLEPKKKHLAWYSSSIPALKRALWFFLRPLVDRETDSRLEKRGRSVAFSLWQLMMLRDATEVLQHQIRCQESGLLVQHRTPWSAWQGVCLHWCQGLELFHAQGDPEWKGTWWWWLDTHGHWLRSEGFGTVFSGCRNDNASEYIQFYVKDGVQHWHRHLRLTAVSQGIKGLPDSVILRTWVCLWRPAMESYGARMTKATLLQKCVLFSCCCGGREQWQASQASQTHVWFARRSRRFMAKSFYFASISSSKDDRWWQPHAILLKKYWPLIQLCSVSKKMTVNDQFLGAIASTYGQCSPAQPRLSSNLRGGWLQLLLCGWAWQETRWVAHSSHPQDLLPWWGDASWLWLEAGCEGSRC